MSDKPAEPDHPSDELGSALTMLQTIGSWAWADRSQDLPTEPRDLALGRFMDAWSELEASLRLLLHMLMKAPLIVTSPVAAAIPDLGRMRELLLALGGLQLEKSEDFKKLEGICKYLQISAKYRNSIVHGQWHTYLMPDAAGQQHLEWVRVYNIIGLSKHVAAVMGWNAGDQEQFVFTVARLEERTEKARQFAAKVDSFAQSIGPIQW